MIREVKGSVDRLSMAFLPDEVGLVAELISHDGHLLGSAPVQENGSFHLLINEEHRAEHEPVLQIRPDVDEPITETLRVPIKAQPSNDGMLDLQKEPLVIPRYLRRIWGPLFEVCCVRGRVVACRTTGQDPLGQPVTTCCSVFGAKVEAYVHTITPWGIRRKVLATAYTDQNGFFRVCTVRIRIPKVIIPIDLPFDWHDLLPIPELFPVPKPHPPWPGPDPAPYEGILQAWAHEQRLTGQGPAIPEAMPRLAALEAMQMSRTVAPVEEINVKALKAEKAAFIRKPEAVPELAERIRPEIKLPLTLPPLVANPCSAGWHFRVTQSVDAITRVIYDDGFFPVPHSTWPFGHITLYANSATVCGEHGTHVGELGDKCFIFTSVGNIGVDKIDGWADTTSLFAGPGPAPFNVPLVKDAAFAGHLSLYGLFAAGPTHYKVEQTRLSGTLRAPGPAGPWVTYAEPFAYATQYINLDHADPHYGEVRTITVTSMPVTVGAEKLYVLPENLVETYRPGPAWQWLHSMQPVVLGVSTADLLPGGAGQCLFRVTPVTVTGAVVTHRCQIAELGPDLRLVIDNTPVHVGVTSLRDENGTSILTAVCPKAHLTNAADALSTSFQAFDDFGHLAGLAVSFRIGNASTETIIPTMVYNNGASPVQPADSYVANYTHLPAGPVTLSSVGSVSLTANFPAVNWAANYWAGGSGSLQAFRDHWLTLVPVLASDPCPFAISISAAKRTTDGFTTPGWVTDMRLFLIRV
ncbi:MAG TPA: hypothetical protein VGK74_28270 [Symbiobacteriaceae bacterium]